MVSEKDREDIRFARKYNLRLGTLKIFIFQLFTEGYSPSEVAYVMRDWYVDSKDRRTVTATIRRYHVEWTNKNK